MYRIHRLIATFVMVAISLTAAAAGEDAPTKEAAVAMVKRAVAYYKENGAEKTIAAINGKSPNFVQGTLYVAANDTAGMALAHPMAPKMVGKNMGDLKDADGKPFVQEMIQIAKSGKPGWVDYRWPNPETKEIQGKTAYVEATPDGKLYFNAGVYK